ncbi:FxSxx-COOH system tetratricopeptide repeat protein [Nocardiopsis terrae]
MSGAGSDEGVGGEADPPRTSPSTAPLGLPPRELAEALFLAAVRARYTNDSTADRASGEGDPGSPPGEEPPSRPAETEAPQEPRPVDEPEAPGFEEDPSEPPAPDTAPSRNAEEAADPTGAAPAPPTRIESVPSGPRGRSDLWAALPSLDRGAWEGAVGPTLPGQEMVAAMGPFHRRDPRGPREELDAERTASDHARSVLGATASPGTVRMPLLPVLRARPRRSVGLTVLRDAGASMHYFQDEVVRSLLGLLRGSGVFRHVRELSFDSGLAGAPVLRDTRGYARDPWRDGDPGPHVVMILTDGIGHAWRDHGFRGWLNGWARRAAVSIVHLLDPHLWRRSGVQAVPAELTAPLSVAPACPNSHYRATGRRLGARPGSAPVAASRDRSLGTSVPVLPLSAEQLHSWALFVMGRGSGTLRSHVLPVPGKVPEGPAAPDETSEPEGEREESARALVRRFAQQAAPSTFRFAVALAAVPMDLRSIRTLGRRVLRRAPRSELSEIFFGGADLVELSEGLWNAPGDGPPVWDFRPGVRGELLALGGRVSEIRSLLLSASEELWNADPFFPVLGAMLGGEENVGPRVGRMSYHWVKQVLPALVSISLDERFPEVVGAYINHNDEHGSQGPHDEGSMNTEDPVVLASSGGSSGSVRSAPKYGGGGLEGEDRDQRRRISGSSAGGASLNRFDENPEVGRPAPPVGVVSVVGGRPSGAAWIQVPRRAPVFVGRAELLRDLRSNIRNRNRQVITALNGMSGVGKSELAKEYIYLHSEEYDLICWIPSRHENQIRQAFTEIAARIGLDVTRADSGHVIHGVLESLRQGEVFRKWLLVFDNAGDRETLDQYIPVAGDGHVIITSQDRSWQRAGTEASLEITEFSRQESVELLRRRGPRGLTEDEAERLAEELGNLPLALNQAAVWLHEVGMDVPEYLRRLAEKSSEMIRLLEPVDPDYPIPVAAAWNVSLEQLAVDSPGAIRLLQLCSFLGTVPIPRSLFRFGRDIDGPEELRTILSDPPLLGMAIRDIGRYSLAHVDHQQDTISLHRLVKPAVQASMSEREQERLKHCAHQLLSRNDPQNDSAEAMRTYARLLPHVLASEAWSCEDAWVRSLVIQLCEVALLQRNYGDALRLGSRAHELWADRLGSDHRDTLRMALQISRAVRDGGELDRAREMCESTMREIGSVLGENSPEYLKAEQEHARNLRMAGLFQDSLDFTTENFDRRFRLFGPDDPETLMAAHFLAYDLRLVGRIQEALQRYADTWERRQTVLGPDHLFTMASIDGYSDTLMESGRYREARDVQQALVDRASALFGAADSGVLGLQGTLATMMRRSGNLEEACELSEHVLREFRTKLGADDADTLRAALHHSLALCAVERFAEALELAEEAGEKYAKLFGEEHTHVMFAQVNRAIILRRLDRPAEARELDEGAMRLLTERLGPDHPSTLACAINLASDHFQAGDTTGARERDENSLELSSASLGREHPLTLLARRNLMLNRTAADSDAESGFDALESSYREVMGADHPATTSLRQRSRGDADIYIGGL